MKKLFVMLIVTVFAFTALTAMAQGTEITKKTPKKISCCIKGECKEMTKADCTKAKGEVVTNCKKCKAKPAKGPAKEPKLDTE
jgi:hypothetical protein